ncbi:MAG: threonine-phosphate decarboxylase CobD [Bacillota bacterium]
MKKVKHGGNVYEIAEAYGFKEEEIVDFSANINPLGLPKSFKKALVENIHVVEKYPDPEYKSLVQTIAEANHVAPENIIVGNGATEIIFSIISALRAKRCLLTAPTFLEYERALTKAGCDVVFYYLKEKNDFQVDDGIFGALEDVDLLILCNPNNPTGKLVDRERLKEILRLCAEKRIHLIVDEAFIDFVDEPQQDTLRQYIDEYKNIYIIRALTKFFALPGLRIGYGISSNTVLLEKVRNEKEPWTVNSYAALAGEILLKDEAYIQESRSWILKERCYLYDALGKISGIKVFKPEANYILIKMEKEGIHLHKELLMRKILIRQCGNYENLNQQFYRVAIKDRESNEKLIQAMKEVFYEA